VCLDGKCLTCTTEETVCGQTCINTASDPDNCGGCGIPCVSGLCSNSTCEAVGTGRVIVIGHDYVTSRQDMNQVLANAVFLWPINPIHVLTYKGDAAAAAIAGAYGAITQVATATGRLINWTDGGTDNVATLLPGVDVFLIYPQDGATNSKLTQLGQDWSAAMATFVTRGGTIILLDGIYGPSDGTVQILAQAALFNVQRNATANDAVCTVAARGDALATGLHRSFRCGQIVNFTTTESEPSVTSVVETGTPRLPVVIDKLF
jgi:hypothetical protein